MKGLLLSLFREDGSISESFSDLSDQLPSQDPALDRVQLVDWLPHA